MAEEKKTSKKAEKADKPKDKKKKSGKNPFKSIASFFKSVKSEGKKVVWAKAKDVVKNTAIVLVVVFIAGVAIFGVDTGLSQIMKLAKNAAQTTTAAEVVDDAEDEADAEDVDAEDEDTADTEEDTTADAENNTEAAE